MAGRVFAVSAHIAAAVMFGRSDPARVILRKIPPLHSISCHQGHFCAAASAAVCSGHGTYAVFVPCSGWQVRNFNFDRFQTLFCCPRGRARCSCHHLSMPFPLTRTVGACLQHLRSGNASVSAAIGRLCHAHGALFAVDAAQSAGILDINMEEMQIDALVVPGHKGLYGPMGSVCFSRSAN